MSLCQVQEEIQWGRRPIGPLLLNVSTVGSVFCNLLEHYFGWARVMVANVGLSEFICAPQGAAWSESGLSSRIVLLVQRELEEMNLPTAHISYTMVR